MDSSGSITAGNIVAKAAAAGAMMKESLTEQIADAVSRRLYALPAESAVGLISDIVVDNMKDVTHLEKDDVAEQVRGILKGPKAKAEAFIKSALMQMSAENLSNFEANLYYVERALKTQQAKGVAEQRGDGKPPLERLLREDQGRKKGAIDAEDDDEDEEPEQKYVESPPGNRKPSDAHDMGVG